MSWPEETLRVMYPQFAIKLERKIKDIYWALDKWDDNMFQNYVKPEFNQIREMYQWFLRRLRAERGEDVTLSELGLLDLGWSIKLISELLEGNLPVHQSIGELKWRCWRLITDVTDRHGIWVIV